MNLKKAIAGVSLAGGVGLALMGVGSRGGIRGTGRRWRRWLYAAGLRRRRRTWTWWPAGSGWTRRPRRPWTAGGPGDRGPGGPGDRGPGGPGGPGDRGPGGPATPGGPRTRRPGGPGDFRGPGGPHDFGPRPADAFRGFHGAPWGDGAAPWGWGPPPRAGWGGPFPPPGGIWNQGPINYWGYNEQPIWDPGQNGWGLLLLRPLDPAVTRACP